MLQDLVAINGYYHLKLLLICCMRKIKVISDKIVHPPRQSETNDLTHKLGTLPKATRKQYLLSLLSSQ